MYIMDCFMNYVLVLLFCMLYVVLFVAADVESELWLLFLVCLILTFQLCVGGTDSGID